MKKPREHADFFKLLSKLFYYLVSGQSKVGYLAAQGWNKYYRAVAQLKVYNAVVGADYQTPQIYDSIVVRPWNEEPKVLEDNVWDEEGPLDGELLYGIPKDMDESIPDDARSLTSSPRRADPESPAGTHVSWDSRDYSPMDES